ncbi:MAG TPA: hypothetical protein VIU63_09255 [Nitrospira sp.]
MADAMPSDEVQAAWAALAQEIRTGVLLTLRNGRPFGSHVPCLRRRLDARLSASQPVGELTRLCRIGFF